MLRLLIGIFFLITYAPTIAQSIEVTGTVTDTLNLPLSYANVLALPEGSDRKVRFAISDSDGSYTLKLDRDLKYQLEVSYLGFKKALDSVIATTDALINFRLQPSSDVLDEATVSVRTPVIIRKDTIIYRPEKFLSGNERKLKDVLKKLPGLEVDRDGNVKVNGKPVTNLLIEGKQFFTGDEKLGVNNIPADAIDEIEALDNYTSVAFLKGLNDSDQLALNIKLKEGKKKFIFGEVEAGAGIKERYAAVPTVFYYSPKTSVYTIGDFNNVGTKSFSTEDYVNFEGGYNSLLENPSSYGNILNSNFSKFLSDTDFVFNRNNFGAASLDQAISSKLTLSAYSIEYDGRIDRREESDIDYFTSDDLDESRTFNSNNDLQFSLSKAKLRYIGYSNTDISYDIFLKTNNAVAERNTFSRFLNDSTIVIQQTLPNSVDFTQNLTIDKKISKAVTSSFTANYKYINSKEDNLWDFSAPVFLNTIPFSAESETNTITQDVKNRVSDIKANLKTYWLLNTHHHLYPQLGISSLSQNFKSSNELLGLGGDETVSLSNEGFNNNLDFGLTDVYFGVEYKVKAGNLIVRPGLFYHYYLWNISQFNNELVNRNKKVILPRVDITWDPPGSKRIKFNYKLISRFGEASQLANRLRLVDFNRIFVGNENIENELYHFVNLNYSYFNLLNGNLWNASLSYINIEQSIRRSTVLNLIEQFDTLLYTDLPEINYNGFVQYTKLVSDFQLEARANVGIARYQREVNEIVQEFSSASYGYTFGAQTNFKNFPNIDLHWKQDFSAFNSGVTQTKFVITAPSINIDFQLLDNLNFEGVYSYNHYKNQTTNDVDVFQIAEASLTYNKEDSPFTVSLGIQNIFDTSSKNVNSSNDFLLSDQRIFIQPRISTLRLAYKF